MTRRLDDRKAESARQRLISQIYEVALRPELYGSLIDLWEVQITQAVARLDELNDAASQELPFRDPEIEEHFARAYQILEKLGRDRPLAQTIDLYLAAQNGPAALISASGTVIGMNDDARRMLGSGGRLSDFAAQIMPADLSQIEAQLLRLDRPQHATEVHVFAVSAARPGTNEPVQQLFITRPVHLDGMTEPALSIGAVSVPWSTGLERLLANSFAMTAGEIAVVRDLADGYSINQISRLRNRLVHTIRTQVKAVLAKMGSATQSDFLRTVSLLSPIAAQGAVNVSETDILSTGKRIDVLLDSRRNLPVNLIGPEDGRPVLFIHGMLDGFAFGPRITELLEAHAIRLIAPSRPGFGDSPPAHDKHRMPEEFARDVESMLKRLGITQCPVIGHLAGAVYAFACAAMLPGTISHVVSIAGAVPIVSLSQFRSMSAWQRVVALTARFTPSLLPTFLRAGIAQIESGGDEAFMKALYTEAPRDQHTAESREVRAALLNGYRFAIAQGHRAFEADSIHVTRNWSGYVARTACPVTLFHGVHDKVVTVDSVRAFRDRHPDAELVELADSGQLVLFQQPADVFRGISDLLANSGKD